MSERYQRLFRLEPNLYLTDAPVLISAGALLKDTKTGKILAQLSFKNIQKEKITALKVQIIPYDPAGNVLDDPVEFSYLDLNIGRDEAFGEQTPIVFSNITTRSFKVYVKEVVLSNGQVWTGADESWTPLQHQKLMKECFASDLMYEEYQGKYGNNKKYVPLNERNIWLCSCGAVNNETDKQCHSCWSNYNEIMDMLDMDSVIYKTATELMKTGTNEAYETAIESFKTILDYEGSDEKIKKCLERIDEIKAKAEADRLERERKAEIDRKEAERKAKRNKKIAVIVTPIVCMLIVFVILLNTVIIPNSKYNEAIALMNSSNYQEAITVFETLDGYQDSKDKIVECKYNEASALMNEGNYENAIIAFEKLDGYMESIDKINQCYSNIYGEEVWNKIKNVNIGDIYVFGTYEQDNNLYNGKESIEWQVLAKDGSKVLVISKFVLDGQKYNISDMNITWERCSLRNWLNNEFINTAFSDVEKVKISTVTNANDKNPEYDTFSGTYTQDKMFILSINEAKKYFSTDIERQCKSTPYAEAQEGNFQDTNGNCYWMLRTAGIEKNFHASVDGEGEIFTLGSNVESTGGVRPAMWIDFSIE